MEAAPSSWSLRHVSAVRPRHLPQPRRQTGSRNSAFSVYLITDYAASEKLLWVRLFNLQNLYQQPWAILLILGILLAIYAICTLLNFIRQALFAVTIDKRRGRWFELLWDKACERKNSQLPPPLTDSANTR